MSLDVGAKSYENPNVIQNQPPQIEPDQRIPDQLQGRNIATALAARTDLKVAGSKPMFGDRSSVPAKSIRKEEGRDVRRHRRHMGVGVEHHGVVEVERQHAPLAHINTTRKTRGDFGITQQEKMQRKFAQ